MRLDGAAVNGSTPGGQREPRATQGGTKSIGATSLSAAAIVRLSGAGVNGVYSTAKIMAELGVDSWGMDESDRTALITKLASAPPEQQFTSSITLGELVYGAHRLQERAGVLLQRLDETLPPNPPVLPFDASAAVATAR